MFNSAGETKCPVCEGDSHALKVEMGDRFEDVVGTSLFSIIERYHIAHFTKQNPDGEVDPRGRTAWVYFHKFNNGGNPFSS